MSYIYIIFCAGRASARGPSLGQCKGAFSIAHKVSTKIERKRKKKVSMKKDFYRIQKDQKRREPVMMIMLSIVDGRGFITSRR